MSLALASGGDAVRARREALWSEGYRPLAVLTRQKRPEGQGWQEGARQNPPAATQCASLPGSANTGILCNGLRVIDIDIEDATIADEVERDAIELLGRAPVRYRDGSGKRALFYRAADGEPKKRVLAGSAGKIEVLGQGQQVVVEGVHPEGMPYLWRTGDGEPLEGLHQYPRAGLVAVTECNLEDFLRTMRGVIDAPDDDPQPLQTAVASEGTDDHDRRMRAMADKALREDCAALASTLKGGRNATLNATAYRLGQFIAGGALTRNDVETALQEACVKNDLWKEDGSAQCRKTIASGIDSGMAAGAPQLRERERPTGVSPFLSAQSIAKPSSSITRLHWDGEGERTSRREIVKGLLPAGEVALLAGQSGAGKTFVAIDLAAALATGQPFFEKPVRERGGTLFLLGEGAGTISERLDAVRAGRLAGEKLPIAWHSLQGSLQQEEVKKTVLGEVRNAANDMVARHGVPLKLVIIDTLAAAFAMQDENDAGEATRVMKIMQEIHKAASDALVIGVHHYGKTAETGARGSSAFTASADAILAVLADKDESTGAVRSRKVALTKSRWRDTGWTCTFQLESVAIDKDEDGEDIRSCYIVPGKQGQQLDSGTIKLSRKSASETFLIQALTKVLGEVGEAKLPFGADGPSVSAAPKEAVRTEFYARYPAEGDTTEKQTGAKRKAFNRALESLMDVGRLDHREIGGVNWIWPPPLVSGTVTARQTGAF